MKDISKHYQHLTTDERFRLFVAALGRKDEQELDRLEDSCPRLNYSMQDYGYTAKKMRFMVFAMASALEGLRTDLMAALAFGLAMSYDGRETEDGDRCAEQMLNSFRKFMRVREGKRQGWRRFCDELSVDPDAIAAPFTEHVAMMERVLDNAYETSTDFVDNLDAEEKRIRGIADVEHRVLTEAWPS